ncbi:MAG TPA: hypothetical protein DD666_20550 [Advenella kashmirensis]|uniref:Uncharacterized protein n=1 Tax=Advenella kashmirensis TaxID=310575 RepID=A0A356LMM0_9BURK|nr:hypothetical protein [Advenella kashmirensis]
MSLDGRLPARSGGFAIVICRCSQTVHRCDFDGKRQAGRSIPLPVQMITVQCGTGQEGAGAIAL